MACDDFDRMDAMAALLEGRRSPLGEMVIRLGDMPRSPRQARIDLERSMAACAAESYRDARARKRAISRADLVAALDARDASPGAGTDGATISKLANEFAGEVYGLLARNYSEVENDDIQAAAEEAARKLLPNILAAALRPARPAAPADGAVVSAELRRLSEAATPGPWTVVAGDDYILFSEATPTEYPHQFKGDDAGRHVARIGNRTTDFGQADAHLFAAAVNDVRARIDAEDRAAARAAERGEG